MSGCQAIHVYMWMSCVVGAAARCCRMTYFQLKGERKGDCERREWGCSGKMSRFTGLILLKDRKERGRKTVKDGEKRQNKMSQRVK